MAVTSLCYPWHFDNLRIAPTSASGIEGVAATTKGDNRVYNLMGVECHAPLAPGIYIRNGKKFIVK